MRSPPHLEQVVLAKLLEVGDRELVEEVRVSAEHLIEVVIVLSGKPDSQIAGVTHKHLLCGERPHGLRWKRCPL